MAKKVWEEKVKSKKSAAVKPKASKTKPQKTAPAKKTVPAKKALPTKKAVTVKKKTVAKAKAPEKAAKKAIPAKKVAPKKTIPAKKTVISKKVASAKKAVVAKKAVAKGKPKAKAVKAVKKSVTVRKMVQVKKTVAQKKKVTPKKPVAVKKAAPTKKEKEIKGMEVIVPKGNKEAEKISALHGKELKTILLKRREDLIKEILESRVRESDPLKRDIGDIYDEASTERERELSLILGDRDRQKLIEIDDALQRMESGEYGVCENCGDRIAPARLKAQPFTKLCINCKAEEERQEARRRKFEIEGVYKNISQPEEEES